MSTLKVTNIQHGSASTAAIALNSDGQATLNGLNFPSAGPLSSRNLIVNGAMAVAQRGTSSTDNGYGTVDRYKASYSGGTVTQTQTAITSGDPYDEGFRSVLRLTNTTSNTGTSANRIITQKIEAQNMANSGWNYTSSSSYVTLSFWARASVAQTYYVNLKTSDGTSQNYSTSFALSADTWTKVTKTIPGNSSVAFDNNNEQGLQVHIVIFRGTDSTTSGHTLDGWAAYSGSDIVPDMTNTWAGTTDATFDITGVQLEVGQVATPFEHRSYADELRRCQRYFQSMNVANMKFTTARWDQSQGVGECNVYLRETMRSAPSFAFTGTWDTGTGWGGDPVMTLAREDFVVLTTTVSTIAASGVKVMRTETAGATISFAAEL